MVGSLALCVGIAAAIVAGSVVTPAASRFADSTSNDGSFMAASAIDLSIASESGSDESGNGSVSRGSLAFDADNLVPGQQVVRCLPLQYTGTVDDVRIRLFGRHATNDPVGLERFLATSIAVGAGESNTCDDFVADDDVDRFDGTLTRFWTRHNAFDSGFRLRESFDDGDSVMVRVAITLDDDDRAQGLSTAFWLTFEVRP